MKGKKRLLLAMGIYAAVFLILTAGGLAFLWKYMDAYEHSRPKHAADAYLEQLTPERILQNAPELEGALDPKIQSRDDVLLFVEDLLESAPASGRKGGDNSYLVRCGDNTIGSFSLRKDSTGPYGLPEWTVAEEHYDLSQFLREPVTVTVPSGYHVLADGTALDESYITTRDIPYDVLEPFYGKYPLPVKVTYTVPAVLGEVDVTLTDETGKEAAAGEDGQWVSSLDNCTDEEEENLRGILQSFLERYVAFAGSKGGSEKANLSRLAKYLVPEGELVRRLRSALAGLSYGQSWGNQLSGWEKNLFFRIDDEHYFCDVTYFLSVTGKKGTVDTEENLRIILTEVNGTLLVEAIDNY